MEKFAKTIRNNWWHTGVALLKLSLGAGENELMAGALLVGSSSLLHLEESPAEHMAHSVTIFHWSHLFTKGHLLLFTHNISNYDSFACVLCVCVCVCAHVCVCVCVCTITTCQWH